MEVEDSRTTNGGRVETRFLLDCCGLTANLVRIFQEAVHGPAWNYRATIYFRYRIYCFQPGSELILAMCTCFDCGYRYQTGTNWRRCLVTRVVVTRHRGFISKYRVNTG